MELKRVFEGLTVIAVGGVLLANSTGWLPWDVWWNILSLWPVLLIAAGVDVIGKGLDNAWLRALSSLLVIAALAYGALGMGPGSPYASMMWPWGGSSASSEPFDLSEPADPDVTEGTALVEGGVGEFTIGGGGDLVAISGESPFEPRFDVEVSGDSADVRVSPGDGEMRGTSPRMKMDVELSEQVAWDLALKSGVTDTDADLSDLEITRLLVETGVSNTTITLGEPRAAKVPVTIQAGVSSTTVRLPRGVSARVRSDSGLSSTTFAEDWEREGEYRVTRAWSDSGDSWDILVKQGVSSVNFVWE